PYLAGADRLPAAARALLAQAGKHLGAELADLPDDSLAADWTYLCKQMATDLETGAATALARLDAVRRAIVHPNNLRMWLVGSAPGAPPLRAAPDPLAAGLARAPLPRPHSPDAPFILDRLRGRHPGAAPRYVGLVNPNTQNGVFVHTAPGTSLADDDDAHA